MKLSFLFAALCYVHVAASNLLTRLQYETAVKNVIDYTALTFNVGF
jgi:hypothetical protein